MRENIITVVVREPGELPEVRRINNDCHGFQHIVGGFFEIVRFDARRRFEIVCNDNFLAEGLEACVHLPMIQSTLCGTVFMAAVVYGGEDGPEFRSMTPDETDQAKRLLLGDFSALDGE